MACWSFVRPMDFFVTHVAETGSTNDDLAAAAREGAPHGSVLVTGHQTTGKGRLGRIWTAPPGSNLLVSVLFRNEAGDGFGIGDPHRLVQRVSVSMALAVESVTGVRPVLKWPNDLLVGDAKLAGVLAQSSASDGRIDWVVVGIGTNVGWAPEGAASLPTTTPDELLDAWLVHLAATTDVAAAYRERLDTLGRAVRVETLTETFDAVATDVLDDGRLVVTTPDGDRVVGMGDVTHLRHAP